METKPWNKKAKSSEYSRYSAFHSSFYGFRIILFFEDSIDSLAVWSNLAVVLIVLNSPHIRIP